jgi:hypothetical protein
VKDDSGGYADVERVGSEKHVDFDAIRGGGLNRFRKAIRFISHNDESCIAAAVLLQRL